jgi:hypothetical protein
MKVYNLNGTVKSVKAIDKIINGLGLRLKNKTTASPSSNP